MSVTADDIRYTVSAENRFASTFSALRRDITDSRTQLEGLAGMAGRINLGVGMFALGTVGAAGFVAGLKDVAHQLDSLNDAADATGSSVEKLSALEHVARRNGESLDVVVQATLKLNKVLNEAGADSPMARALQSIGLNAQELRSLDPADAVQRVAKALTNFADDGNKARLVQELFGKSVKEVAPFLKDLAEFGALNTKVTKDQAEAAERFNKHLAEMATRASDAGRSIVSSLLPAANQYLALINRLASGPGLTAAIGEAFKGNVFSTAQEALDHYAAKVQDLDRQIAAIKTDPRPLMRLGLPDLEAQRTKMAGFATVYRELVNMTSAAGAGRGTGGVATSLPSVPKIAEATKVEAPKVSEAERYLEALQKQAERLQQLTTYEQLLSDVQHGRIDGLTPAILDQLKAQALQNDRLKEAADLAKAYAREEEEQLKVSERLTEEQKRAADQADEFFRRQEERDASKLDRLLSRTNAGQLASLQNDLTRLQTASLELPADDPRQLQLVEALRETRRQIDDTALAYDRMGNAIDAAFASAARSLTAFVTGQGDLTDVARNMGREFARALIEDPLREAMRNAAKDLTAWLRQLGRTMQDEGSSASWLDALVRDASALTGGGSTSASGTVGSGITGNLPLPTMGPTSVSTSAPIAQTNYFTIQSTDAATTQRQIDASIAAANARLQRRMAIPTA